MNEEKNNLENNNPEDLNYSFDFSSQVEPEVQTPVQPAPVQEQAQPTPQMVDVSVPVMEETQTVVEPVQEPAQAAPQMVDVSVPVVEETQTVVEPVQEQAQAAPQMVDVSVPVMEETQTVVEQAQQPAPTETTEELKDGKSTMRFVIILGIIIVAFIIALPFVLNILGY